MFKPRESKPTGNMIYKTLYISEELVKEVEEFANKNNTSLNSMIVQMVEHCVKELKESDK